eukprot:748884-Amphidinium_carterae.1
MSLLAAQAISTAPHFMHPRRSAFIHRLSGRARGSSDSNMPSKILSAPATSALSTCLRRHCYQLQEV